MVQEGLVDYCQVKNFYDSENVHVVNLIVVLGSLISLFLGSSGEPTAHWPIAGKKNI